MTKQFIKPPKKGKERVLFFAELAKGISGNLANKQEMIDLLAEEGVELTEDLKSEITTKFPEIRF